MRNTHAHILQKSAHCSCARLHMCLVPMTERVKYVPQIRIAMASLCSIVREIKYRTLVVNLIQIVSVDQVITGKMVKVVAYALQTLSV